MVDIEALNLNIWKCKKCARFQFLSMPGYFPKNLEILIVGRNPGQLHIRDSGWDDHNYSNLEDFEEFQKLYEIGLFEAPIGKFLEDLVDPSKLIFGFTNICKCRTPNNSSLLACEIENCRGYLNSQIILSRPKAVITLGAIAAFWWAKNGATEILFDGARRYLFGDFVEFKFLNTDYTSYLLPLPHPASVLYNRQKANEWKKYISRLEYV